MKAKHVVLAITTLILLSCNSAPKTPEAAAAPEVQAAPADSVNNTYDRKEVKEIDRDTTKVAEP
ncbi:MAG: hypothetical protein IPO60_11075 [Flavobacteriales bacterium]|jgi:endonuclease YncB( thermonuclease family)|nr:hypothetical protein [Flavobacteriales bacterium]MBK9598835.1 hypothetical protein [Flavobacteriales bacterium]